MRILPHRPGHNRLMTEHEPETEEEQPDEPGNPWAKTSSGDADKITEDDD